MMGTLPRTTREILDAAADLLDRPGGWTQFAFARDAAGNEVYPKDPNASSFDVVGAIKRVSPSFTIADEVIEMIPYIDGKPLSRWNDDTSRTQSEVADKIREIANNNKCLTELLMRIAVRHTGDTVAFGGR